MDRSSGILDGLTPQQAAAATQTGAVLVLAGAGTGKTKTLTRAVAHRIEVRGILASRVLAVTFTNKAAAEMAGRIQAVLGDGMAPRWIGTFHGLGARQLRIESEMAGLRPGFDILDADDSRRVVKRVMKALNLAAEGEAAIGRDPLKAMCGRISKFKDHLVTPEDAPARIEAMVAAAQATGQGIDPHGLRASARVYAEYQRVLRDANAADFGDYQRPEIKDALALLRLAATPDDVQADEALRRVVNTPPRGFGAKAMRALEDEAAWRRVPMLAALETAALPSKARAAGLAFADAVRGVGQDDVATLADQLSLLLDRTGYRAMLRESRAETTEGQLDNLQELIQLAGRFHTARDLLDHAALCTGGPNEEAAERVRLMTLHKSKGLEFGHVFLPGWELGSFPSLYGDPAEERRLAYMAITRGMRRVTISHCDFRHGYTMPCPFLKDIPDQHRFAGWLRGPPSLAPRPGPSPRTRSTAQRCCGSSSGDGDGGKAGPARSRPGKQAGHDVGVRSAPLPRLPDAAPALRLRAATDAAG